MSWLNVRAFTREVNKDHPGVKIADEWRSSHKMVFMDFDKFANLIEDQEVLISYKMDGENIAIYHENGQTVTVTNRGTIRYGMQAVNEINDALSKYKQAIFMGEMYAVDENGKPLSYVKGAKILKNPDKGYDDQIRVAVFDIISIEGSDETGKTMDQKVAEINQIFANKKYVHPAKAMKMNLSQAKQAWDNLEKEGIEGFVAYHQDQMIKVKPIMSFDMAIVAVSKSDKYPDRIGAVLCAFLDKESRFRMSGMIGGGFSDEERVELMQWAKTNAVEEDEDYIWIDPFKDPMVVEVEAIEVNEKNKPVMDFKNGKWVQLENGMSGVLRFPRIKRTREDKTTRYEDIPVEQVGVESSVEQAQTLYVDLDGVLANYDDAFQKKTGFTPNEYDLQEGVPPYWDVLRNDQEYWENLEWIPGAEDFWNSIKPFNPTILTSPLRDESSKKGKRAWVEKNLGPGVPVIVQSQKVAYAKPGAVLVDDRPKHIDPWIQKGGVGILHDGNYGATLKAVQEAMSGETEETHNDS